MTQAIAEEFVFSHKGFCQLCDAPTLFAARWQWFREHLICMRCRSIPRERALYATVELFYPDWRTLRIHEWSPTGRGASVKFMEEAPRYIASAHDPELPVGKKPPAGGLRNERLDHQSFKDNSFDLVITQDAFEHVFDPESAIREIARTLRPGGAHICTVPLVNKEKPSVRRASLSEGGVIHHLEPEYHGDPRTGQQSLVTFDWGYDIAGYLARFGGLEITLVNIDNIDLGIRAEYNEVLVCRKPQAIPTTGGSDL
jgi:SAM-dependent methyltransferase